jgi:DNA-binding SARP family transcriptional activator
MTARAKLARKLTAALALIALLLLLALAWDLRPALPPMPQSLSQPLPGRTISAVLDVAAWVVAVLLDLVLLGRVVQLGMRSTPSRNELRLRRAFAQKRAPVTRPHNWRAHAAPLALPVLRLPVQLESEPKPVRADAKQLDLHESPMPVEAASRGRDELPGVLLLGPFELTGYKKKQPRRKATTELIAYLAMQRRRVSRDELLEALWPGDDPRRSAARFYQAVSEARKLLGEAFQRERDTYMLDRQQLSIDLDELDRVRTEAEAATGDLQQTRLEDALALFRGQALDGIGALWADTEARHFCSLQVDLLERVGRLRLESGEVISALEVAERASALDPSNERPIQLAMEAEAALGRREAVVERYEQLCRELDQQFGLEPSRETKLLQRRLLSQDSTYGLASTGSS